LAFAGRLAPGPGVEGLWVELWLPGFAGMCAVPEFVGIGVPFGGPTANAGAAPRAIVAVRSISLVRIFIVDSSFLLGDRPAIGAWRLVSRLCSVTPLSATTRKRSQGQGLSVIFDF
jgi:hypothetical protein